MILVFDPVGAPWRIDCCGTRFGARKKVVDMVGGAGEEFVRIPVRSGMVYAAYVECLNDIMIYYKMPNLAPNANCVCSV
jgi:hypothetical protein